MNLQELLSLPIAGKQVLIIGRPGSGKTWLSKQLDPNDFDTLHSDDYLVLGDPRAIYELTQDAPIGFGKPFRIIEGMLGYKLLLEGAMGEHYSPDIVIECSISAGKQREIYLAERNPEKLRYLKKFEFQHLETMNEYHRIVPAEQKPIWITFENHWEYATEPK